MKFTFKNLIYLEKFYKRQTLPYIHALYNFVGVREKMEHVTVTAINMQVPRYLLFCERGSFSAHALTLVGTKLTPYIGIML